MTASFESRMKEVEQKVARISNPSKLSDFDNTVLLTQISFVEYVTPLKEVPKLQTYLNKIRGSWSKEVLLKYIKKMERGNFIKRLSEDQIYLLLEGKEKQKSKSDK